LLSDVVSAGPAFAGFAHSSKAENLRQNIRISGIDLLAEFRQLKMSTVWNAHCMQQHAIPRPGYRKKKKNGKASRTDPENLPK
jgi:hypothetical protein